MIKIIGLPKETAMVLFGFLAITGPMFGVFFGGYISDFMVRKRKSSFSFSNFLSRVPNN